MTHEMGGRRLGAFGLLVAATIAAGPATAQSVLKVRLDGELKEMDPIWTSSYPVRNHAYLIYDTLFAADARWQVQPQMAASHEVSADGLAYTIRLRDGLAFHDGQPVTAKDAIASLERWGKKDGLGQQLMSRLARFEAVDDKTFRLVLRERWGLVMESLGKISSFVPFVMPERLAKTDANAQVKEPIGSGPFRMKLEEWVPGARIVYEKNAAYKPRPEPASGAAGGKLAKVDRVEWVVIPDSLTAVNALAKGEIDYLETVPPDMIDSLKANPQVATEVINEYGKHVQIVLNHHQPPFDNVRIRQAVQKALKQEDYLLASFGERRELYQVCAAVFFCGSKFDSQAGIDRVLKPDPAAAKQMLQAAGYDGTPITVLHATDIQDQKDWGYVTIDALKKAGFVVDHQMTDWATVASRRTSKKPVKEGGWHIFHTGWAFPDMMNPAVNVLVSGGCLDKAWFGWPCDEELERLRTAFAGTSDPAEQKRLADAVQARAHEIVTFVPMGQVRQVTAYRKSIAGVIKAPVPFLWNVEKK